MLNDTPPSPENRSADAGRAVTPEHDPDLARLIELVERIGGHGEQPL